MDSEIHIFNKIARSHMYWGRKPLAGLHNVFGDVKPGGVVLDPFCGGGTGVVAALQRGARVIASDLNPMAVFLTKVLVRPINIPVLERAFESVEAKVAERILKNYTIKCSRCGRNVYFDYLVWNEKHEKAIPEKVSARCLYCGKTGLEKLSRGKLKRQLHLARIQPKRWYPKTSIKSTRESPVAYHSELFTGRNLYGLAELLHAIKQLQRKDCKEALMYVFTAMLYSCSEMQMFSELEPSSSRGWTAWRYYVPKKRKEKNVWRTFYNRFQRFKSCKEVLNRLIPRTRVTDSLREFFRKDYEAVVYQADAFRLASCAVQRATCVFIDPPYHEDIDYLGFSQFWGCWLKMSFDFKTEWHPNHLKSKGLKKILKSIHDRTTNTCNVTLAFGPKKPEGWDKDNCISESGYIIRQTGTFFYDHSHKKGKTYRRKDQFLILTKREIKTKKAEVRKDKFEASGQQGLIPYLRIARFFFPRESSEKLRALAANYFVPNQLQDLLRVTTEPAIVSATKEAKKNRNTYFSFCFILSREILAKDGWSIEYRNVSYLEDLPFMSSQKTRGKRSIIVPHDVVFIASKGSKRLLFCFHEIAREKLSRNIRKSNVNYVVIVHSKRKMNELREVHNANKWPKAFFVCFDELRSKFSELNKNTYLSLFAEYKPIKRTTSKTVKSGIACFEVTVDRNRKVGGMKSKHYKLRFISPELQTIVPGQFIMMDTSTKKHRRNKKLVKFSKAKSLLDFTPRAYLKRPFGIHRAFYHNFPIDYLKNLSLPPNLATILHTVRPHQFDIFYKVLDGGLGTTELTRLRKGDKVHMIGPLGKRFDLRDLRSEGFEEVHVIGGGVGMAPLIFMVQALRFYAFRVKAFIGIESLEFLKHRDSLWNSYAEDPQNMKLYIDDLLAAGVPREDIYVSCDKPQKIEVNSYRNLHIGLVSERYEKYVRQNLKLRGTKVVAFTCGPYPMMKAIKKIALQFNITLKILMEKSMACGTGVCFSCVCKTEKNGKRQYSRVCTDGPVFNAEEIVWE